MGENSAKIERNIKIVELFIEQNKSITDIGDEFGITRSRVQQILDKACGSGLKEFVKVNKETRAKKRTDAVPFKTCKNCGAQFKAVKKFCSILCYSKFREEIRNNPVVKEERQRKRLAQINAWQQAHPEKIAEYNRKAKIKLDANPNKEEILKKRNRRVKERLIERLGSEEAYKKYTRDKTRAGYEKMKADPLKWAMYKERMRNNKKKYIEKLKKENPKKYNELREKHNLRMRKRAQKIAELRRKNYEDAKTSIFIN